MEQEIAMWSAQLGEVRESLLQMQSVNRSDSLLFGHGLRVGLLPI